MPWYCCVIPPKRKSPRSEALLLNPTCVSNVRHLSPLVESSVSTRTIMRRSVLSKSVAIMHNIGMNSKPSYCGYRYPAEIIRHSVWLYHRFALIFRDVEDLVTERGIIVSHESIRKWCRKFGPSYTSRLPKRQGHLGDMWPMDKVMIVNVRGERRYLWSSLSFPCIGPLPANELAIPA